MLDELKQLRECGICGSRNEYGRMFRNRCADCQEIGFHIWGFGEFWEMEREKESIESQREKILNWKEKNG